MSMARIRRYRATIKKAISFMTDDEVRTRLLDAVHNLNCVATGFDGDEEMTLEQMKAGARSSLESLGISVWEHEEGDDG